MKVWCLFFLVVRNCGKKFGGGVRRGVIVGFKVFLLGLWLEKGWKVGEVEREVRSRRFLVRFIFGILSGDCVLYYRFFIYIYLGVIWECFGSEIW